MPKKASTEVKTFKPEKASTKKTAVAKLTFGKVPADQIETTVKDLLTKAKASGLSPEFGRGTVTLY